MLWHIPVTLCVSQKYSPLAVRCRSCRATQSATGCRSALHTWCTCATGEKTQVHKEVLMFTMSQIYYHFISQGQLWPNMVRNGSIQQKQSVFAIYRKGPKANLSNPLPFCSPHKPLSWPLEHPAAPHTADSGSPRPHTPSSSCHLDGSPGACSSQDNSHYSQLPVEHKVQLGKCGNDSPTDWIMLSVILSSCAAFL